MAALHEMPIQLERDSTECLLFGIPEIWDQIDIALPHRRFNGKKNSTQKVRKLKIKLHLLSIASIAIFLTACNKPQAGSSEAGPASESNPFAKTIYRAPNGREGITLISDSECEYFDGPTIVVGKYTRQGDTLRAVVTAMGTSQVFYYYYVENGLKTEKGIVYLSADKLANNNGFAIALACMEFARNNQGNLPASLDMLIPQYMPDNRYLLSPFSPNAQENAYDYFPGNTNEGNPSRKMLSSRYRNADGKQLIIRYNCGVKFE